MFQATYIEIDNFRKWTESHYEDEIQLLQNRVVKNIIRCSPSNDFFLGGRGDNFLTLSNGCSLEDYEHLLDMVEYNVQGHSISIGVGCGKTFFEAQEAAAKALHEYRSVRQNVTKALKGRSLQDSTPVSVLHVDVDNISCHVDQSSPLGIDALLYETEASLRTSLAEYGTTVFLLSGDNYIAPIPFLQKHVIEKILSEAEREGVSLKAGVGIAASAGLAADRSGRALKHIRENGYKEKVHVNYDH